MREGIFKAYDIRGIYPSEIDEPTVYAIMRAYCDWLKPKQIALGRDVRISGAGLLKAAKSACRDSGVNVIDIGVVTTDMLYFAVANYLLDGGVIVTASHNPAQYNGLKMVREGARPISEETGLTEIKDLAIRNNFPVSNRKGELEQRGVIQEYINRLLHFIKTEDLRPFTVAVNPNFGAAGRPLEKMTEFLPLKLIKINYEENGTFPKGRPDPIRPENQAEMSDLIKKSQVDFGVAWDADADRCFFFDEKGQFIDGYYTVAVLAEIMLDKYPASKVVYTPTQTWAIIDSVTQNGGVPVVNRVGHSFIKERMRKENAVFGGENSGHFYFKDYFFSDNGMLPFLLMLEKLSLENKKLSEIMDPLKEKYPVSGEINFTVTDPKGKIVEIEDRFSSGKTAQIDGVSVEFNDWRFNIRPSNTEPIVRLNLEAKTKELVREKVRELTKLIQD